MRTDIHIRIAELSDRGELRAMQAHSMRTLAAPYYGDDVVDSFIGAVGTMDDTLLEDRTYFVATRGGRILGCGGWSWRTPAYATRLGDLPAASTSKATVRSIYVHPDHARRGIARSIMARVETEIVRAGFRLASLTATLSGIPLYRRLGYISRQPVSLQLPNDLTFIGLGMEKTLGCAVGEAA